MSQIVLQNAALLDGTVAELREGMHVLVEDDCIREISDVPITASGARTIDLNGKTLMPGLIDAHVHLMATTINRTQLMNEPMSLAVSRARHLAEATLQRGFTSVRDAGICIDTRGSECAQ